MFTYILKPGTDQEWGGHTMAQDLIWLPTDTPFGNLQLKFLSIERRLGHANLRLRECYDAWTDALQPPPTIEAVVSQIVDHRSDKSSSTDFENEKTGLAQHIVDQLIGDHGSAIDKHLMTSEEAVTSIRRCADELVSLLWYLNEKVEKADYPKKLKVDSIGQFLKCSPSLLDDEHREFLKRLNDLSNSYKHSFLQSNVTRIGLDEPRVFQLTHPHNDSSKDQKFDQMRLSRLVNDFNKFLDDCFDRLGDLSRKIVDS